MANFPRPPVKGPLVIPNCDEVKVLFSQGSAFQSIVLHGNLTAVGPLNPSVAETIFSQIKASAATTAWLTHIHPSMSLFAVHVKDLRAANNPTLESSGAAAPGTSAGTPSPASAALVVTLTTQFSGKGFFGRSYLPGITADNIADARHWNSAIGNPAVAFLNAINAAMTSAGFPWVLAHRQLAGNTDPGAPPAQQQPRPAGVLPIQAAVVRDYRIDTQRRRLGR